MHYGCKVVAYSVIIATAIALKDTSTNSIPCCLDGSSNLVMRGTYLELQMLYGQHHVDIVGISEPIFPINVVSREAAKRSELRLNCLFLGKHKNYGYLNIAQHME